MIKIDISKKLHGGTTEISLDVDIVLQENEFVAISGKSGSGKTTLLRILAGLEDADGTIDVLGVTWLGKKSFVDVQNRNIGFVFQDYALFEHMSVVKNLLYVKKDKELANHLLELTQLKEFSNRSVSTLSGGQKQRVALCRAFMGNPKLLLMDEPLSALDPLMRLKLQDDILKLHKHFQTTVVMVSHDPSEIYKLADRVIVLEDGKIIDDGIPKDILLKTKGSQKFSLRGEVVAIQKADIIFVVIVAIGQQLVEVVVDEDELSYFKVGESVEVSTKAFAPTITPLSI